VKERPWSNLFSKVFFSHEYDLESQPSVTKASSGLRFLYSETWWQMVKDPNHEEIRSFFSLGKYRKVD